MKGLFAFIGLMTLVLASAVNELDQSFSLQEPYFLGIPFVCSMCTMIFVIILIFVFYFYSFLIFFLLSFSFFLIFFLSYFLYFFIFFTFFHFSFFSTYISNLIFYFVKKKKVLEVGMPTEGQSPWIRRSVSPRTT